jgi:hypothetical protein
MAAALGAIVTAGALPVLTILLNGKENHELTDCCLVAQNNPR